MSENDYDQLWVTGTIARLEAEIDTLRAQLAEQAALLVSRWQPIETAPKDGSTVLLYCPGGVGVVAAAWLTADIHWWHVDDGKHGPFLVRGPSPTLWMPLPGLPVEAKEE